MPSIMHLFDIPSKKGIEFLKNLFESYVIVFEKLDGIRFSFERVGDELVFYKRDDKKPITLVERTIMKLYEKPIEYFEDLFERSKDSIPEGIRFGFEYFPNTKPITIIYDKIPKNHLVLTDAIKDGKFLSTKELNEWADLFDVQRPPVYFEGKLNEKQKERILEFVNTPFDELTERFKTESFVKYVISVINPELKSTALNNDLDKPIEGVVFKFINKDLEFTAKLVDPIFTKIAKEKAKKSREAPVSNERTLLFEMFFAYLQTLDFSNYSPKGRSEEELYIDFISEVFLDFVKKFKNELKLISLHNEESDFSKDENFRINPKFLKNKKLLKLLRSDRNLESIFKYLLITFSKPRKRASKNFDKQAIQDLNSIINKIKSYLDMVINENYNEVNESLDFIYENLDEEKLREGRKKVNVIIGRFQPFTNGHLKLAKKMYTLNGLPSIIAVVRSRSDKNKNKYFSDKLTLDYLYSISKAYKFIEDVIVVQRGFLGDLFYVLRPVYEPVWVGVGSDRYESFKKQLTNQHVLKMNPMDYFDVVSISRGDLVSATKVREALLEDDLKTFKKLTPKPMWSFYHQLQDELQKRFESFDSNDEEFDFFEDVFEKRQTIKRKYRDYPSIKINEKAKIRNRIIKEIGNKILNEEEFLNLFNRIEEDLGCDNMNLKRWFSKNKKYFKIKSTKEGKTIELSKIGMRVFNLLNDNGQMVDNSDNELEGSKFIESFDDYLFRNFQENKI